MSYFWFIIAVMFASGCGALFFYLNEAKKIILELEDEKTHIDKEYNVLHGAYEALIDTGIELGYIFPMDKSFMWVRPGMQKGKPTLATVDGKDVR